MHDRIRINSIIYSWHSLAFRFDNTPWTGVVAVDFEEVLERALVPSNQQDAPPLGMSDGVYIVKGLSVKMLSDSADALTDYLVNKVNGGPIGKARFSMLVQASNPANTYVGSIRPPPDAFVPITISAATCAVSGIRDAYEEGVDEILTELSLTTLKLTRNTKSLWTPPI